MATPFKASPLALYRRLGQLKRNGSSHSTTMALSQKLTVAISLLALLPAISTNQNVNVIPVTNPQITLEQLLASQGLNSGQVAILVIAPQNVANTQKLFSGKAFQALPTNNQQRLYVEAPVQPIQVHYKSQSVPLNVQHTHIPAPKHETQLSRSEEEPHKIIHEVIRPVIQEVREIIQPYRRIVQEIRPVKESVHQSISTNKQQAKPATEA